jgi:hypothetical protein
MLGFVSLGGGFLIWKLNYGSLYSFGLVVALSDKELALF